MAASPAMAHGPLTVLLVDDVADVRLVLGQQLEQHGPFVVVGEAGDGEEAVEAAASTRPEIVLLDLDMPRVGGLDALPRLRQVAPDALIVVLSGLPRDPMERRSLAAGAVGFIEKGVSARQLVDELLALAGVLETVEAALVERRFVRSHDGTSARSARRFVAETLQRWDCADVLDDVALLVSELVTNAVTHGGSDAEVVVVLRRDAIRVEVRDDSAEIPERRTPSPTDVSGRGLELVSRLSTAWGAHRVGPGKVVWFELPRLDASGAGRSAS
jgi:DNA-binding NarL/FixJ family response regulator